MAEHEVETASFVLAYLLKNKYSQTAAAFLQECQVLPSKSLLILPETPLQTIISEHKARSDTAVLINKMGHAPTWKALWDKLQATLQQLRMVFEEDSTVTTTLNASSSKLSQRSRVSQRRKIRPPPTSQSSQPPPTPPPPLTPQAPLTPPHPLASQPTQLSPHPHPGIASPHRRKPVPRRKELPVSPSKAAPLSPGTQHVLDSLIGDSELPSKLADIINRCVSREDVSADLSSVSMDSIIDQTYSDPALEGLISQMTSGPGTDHVTTDHATIEVDSVTAGTGHMTTGADHVTTGADHVTTGTDHVTTDRMAASESLCPPAKKTRVESSLTEQDIDDWLDQLHSNTS